MSWPLASLGEVAPSRPLKNPEIVDENSVWQLNLDKVESHSGVVTEKVYASVQSAGSSTHWFDERHVLYSKLRPYLNKVVLPEEQGLATTELVPLFPDKDRLDRKYLTYYLRSNSFVNWISDQVAGAKMPRVSMKVFWEHQIPLPPLEEQKRIAAILDKADSVRRKRQQAIDLADDFLRSVFLDMFGEHFTTEGYAISHKKKIKELVDYIDYRGKTPKKSDSGIPLVTAKNVKKGFVSEEPREFIPAENYLDWMTRGLPKEGDVLFTTEAPLGNAALLGCYDKVVVGQRLIALTAKGELTQEYLLYCLLNQFIQDEIYKRSSGSTVKGIRTKELYEIELPVPDIKLQEKFSKAYKKSVQSKHKLQEAIIESDNMFNSLSQKAFAGEL
ncbi:restriction endonuclease subunit S [Pseudoalteromonas sp. PAB 2.2]|uniref:restriction endonuclease subunit S n=1 Tax=Pseudoalteromonas sp. PAB 2.2 TaxID=1841508 RepID=UPI00094FCA62|nr:restriction endonuclease subunit S [Pseudoalteromonas sp. PAB 2.2]